jgi:DNA-directed RNA polymerase subunit RPC12/RpoP
MSEFKYACPVCGQHIKCDSSQAGMVMTCPTCFQKITVPNAPASQEQKFILTGTKVGNERPLPKLTEPAPVTPADNKFPGTIAVTIILVFIVAVVAIIYYETIFEDSRRHSMQSAQAKSNPVPAIPGGATNLALHRAAFASTEQWEHAASNGNDGNLQTRWCATGESLPQWWTVDLNNTAIVTNAQIVWEHNAAYRYLIETSIDNSNWTVVVDESTNTTPASMNSDDFSARGRFFRVVITGLPGGLWASFYEFRAFGTINGK